MKIVIHSDYEFLKNWLTLLPVQFSGQGKVVYQARNIIKCIPVENINLSVKSFKKPILINRFVYTFFRKSKARRSYEHGLRLKSANINTPNPVAYIESYSSGLLDHSFYICLHEEFDGLMREVCSLKGNETVIKQFAQFTGRCHEKEILHKDYSPGNILFKKKDDEYVFYLVDINRMAFGEVGINEGCKNFKRLWTGDKSMLRYIADVYAETRGFDPMKCQQLIIYYFLRFWKRYNKRHR